MFPFIPSSNMYLICDGDMQWCPLSLEDCSYTGRKIIGTAQLQILSPPADAQKELHSQGIQCQFLATAGTRHSHGVHLLAYM